MQCVILHPPTLSSYLSPFALSDARASVPHRSGIAYSSQSCQPQLSFIVSTIYDSVYTGGSGGDNIGPSRDLKFRNDSSARDRSYILAGDSAAHRMPFYRSGSPYSHLISHHANLVPPLLNYPCRNYIIKTILLRNLDKNLSHAKNIYNTIYKVLMKLFNICHSNNRC